MRAFQTQGLMRAIGMRGPHRFALHRLNNSGPRTDKVVHFRALFERIQPNVLAVRDNLLTPQDQSEGIFAFAAARNCGVLIDKPLAQGLSATTPTRPACSARATIAVGSGGSLPTPWPFSPLGEELRKQVGPTTTHVVRIALWSCLQRYEHAAVLVGFTTPDQIRMNLTCLGPAPTEEELAAAREIMARVQAQLDASGEVFLDERAVEVAP